MQDTNITKKAYKAVVGKFEGKRPLGRSRPRVDNIIGDRPSEGTGWILSQQVMYWPDQYIESDYRTIRWISVTSLYVVSGLSESFRLLRHSIDMGWAKG